jgi:putative IMPACT (imprinted ancient) family translation regulator
LMPGRQAYRMNDDGEPTGTAGKPIFGAIQSADLTNILIVVIRYFGGTKLGISGLINAYRKSAKEAIEKSVIVPKFITEYYKIDFEYINLNNVMHIVKENSVYIVSNEFGMKCDMQLAIRRNDSSKVLNKLSQIKNLTINYLYTS